MKPEDMKPNEDNGPFPNFELGTICPRSGQRLLPAIAQDATSNRVVMMAWMNEAALAETLSTGQATYFSRSRGQLWRKGETSGHRQAVREVRIDCDADAILIIVDQTGAACHEGYASCFFRVIDPQGNAIIADQRLVDPKDVYGDPKHDAPEDQS